MGFQSHHIAGMVFGESLFIAGTGGCIGILLTFPVASKFGEVMGNYFPVFQVDRSTIYMDLLFCLIVGIIAGIFPTWRAVRIKIADGLRRIG
jgi:putative ABC transport system permease protein